MDDEMRRRDKQEALNTHINFRQSQQSIYLYPNRDLCSTALSVRKTPQTMNSINNTLPERPIRDPKLSF